MDFGSDRKVSGRCSLEENEMSYIICHFGIPKYVITNYVTPFINSHVREFLTIIQKGIVNLRQQASPSSKF